MNKVFILLFIFYAMAFGSEDSPPDRLEHKSHGFELRFIKQIKNFNFLYEYKQSKRYQNSRYSHHKLGSYFKLGDGLKLGGFITEAYGLRHQDDWVRLSPGVWGWEDTTQRKEYIYNLSISKNFRLSSLSPNVFGLKLGYFHNQFNRQSFYRFEPSWHYFHLTRGVPSWSIKLSSPFYKAINFKSEPYYKLGLYSSYLYHYSQNTLFSISYKYLRERWTQSQESIERESEDYEALDLIQELLFSIILTY